MSTAIILPRILNIGAGASSKIVKVLRDLACQKPLIVTDAMMVSLGYVPTIQGHLTKANIASDIYADTVPEPTVASIQAGVELVRNGDYDSIIAIGGGSPIDSAKAIAILGKLGGEMADYKVPRIVDESGLPVIAIPTTAGTGSEATKATVITNEVTDEKMLCMGNGFVPAAALVDYSLTLSLPPRTTADTGIDALTHAIEAYVSKKANPFTDAQALQAMSLIAPNLRRVFNSGHDPHAREAMMLGATLAGIAFSNSSVALVHGMSRPIGAFFHVPHGLSNAMLLPAVTRFSISAASKRYADCARAMGLASPTETNASANDKLVSELEQINLDLNVPSLAEFGVLPDKFDSLSDIMAQQALESGSPANNPKVPTKTQIIEIYKQLWKNC